MTDYMAMEAYRRKYFPMCMLNIFTGCLSMVCLLAIVKETYLRGFPISQAAQWLQVLGYPLVAVTLCCNIMISQGRTFWLWGAVGVLVFCLLGSLCAIVYSPSAPWYVLGILFPLLGLLLFNSKRHRLFFKRFVEFRQERALALQTLAMPLRIDKPKIKTKTTRREIAANNRLRDRATKAALIQRQARNRVTYPIATLVVLVFIGLLCYSIYDSLVSGVAYLIERSGPIRRYSVAVQPGSYWFAIAVQVFWAVMGLLGLSALLYFYRLEARK